MANDVTKRLVDLMSYLDELYVTGIITQYRINRGFNDEVGRLDMKRNCDVAFALVGYPKYETIHVDVYPEKYHIIDCRMTYKNLMWCDVDSINDLAELIKKEL